MMNSEPFNEYIKTYSQVLSRLCFLLCGNKFDAEDLFQETWIKAIKNHQKRKGSVPYEKWLCRICVNTYKDMMKSPHNSKRINFCTNDSQEEFIASIPDRSASDEKYRELLECIRELPEKYRTVIALRYFSDYSEKDMARILKIPVGTVKSRLNKAKAIINRRINNE